MKLSLKSKLSIILLLIISLGTCLYFFNSHPKTQDEAVKESTNVAAAQGLIVPTLAYSESSITLAWYKPNNYADISYYNIYKDGKLIGDTKNYSASPSASLINNFYNAADNSSAVKISQHNYTVTNLKPNTPYTFTVKAVDTGGLEKSIGLSVVQRTSNSPKIFDVTKYGAIGDGKTIDTKAIQKTIDASYAGGEVLLPSGKTFKSGAIWLKPGVIFKVDGTLLGSDNPKDYINSKHPTKKDEKDNALINCIGDKKIKDLKIIGSGTIDGNGWKQGNSEIGTNFPNSLNSSLATVEENGILAANQFKLSKDKGLSKIKAYSTRSDLVSVSHVDNVYFGDGLSFENPSQQTIGISDCNNVVLNGALIKTFDCSNGDGIDFNSQGLTVLNSVFDTGDDDINFTAGKGADAEGKRKPVDSVWIFDNYFGRGHGAVVAGSNTAAWIENILAEDNVLDGTGAGLRCKTASYIGGGAKDIIFRDSALKNINDGEGEPFIFTSNYTNSTESEKVQPAKSLPVFKDISVYNCSVDGSKNSAIFIDGLKNSYDENINFKDITFKNTKPAKIEYLKNSSFKNIIFSKNIKNPWQITSSFDVSVDPK
ncbi:fibronectin type III domain-containing protein [Clostridium sp. 19966]|uniref:glycosyl hydrolase family 28 protein n=1 Tax=Clostridium sp. 19966 TaxID=2768166 RepID=UPI0028E02D65|nr:glycosyl hydrolase family 28 protein [Clostridium sp. 19966]MDT8716908.1 fibronectin type III domain-containing protein [Clostridium sp. 19966]